MSVKHCVGAVGESLLYKVIIILQEFVNVIIGLEVGLQDCLQYWSHLAPDWPPHAPSTCPSVRAAGSEVVSL